MERGVAAGPSLHHSGRRAGNVRVCRVGGRSYAVMLGLDADLLDEACPGRCPDDAHAAIRRFLTANGFTMRGGTYVGDGTIDAVRCVCIVQRMAQELPWFSAAVRDIRMLRIEENNDLMPAVERMTRRAS